MQKKSEQKRFWELDALRGAAVLMMILFHSLWNINYLGITQISLYSGFWGLFQKATAGTFLLLVGVMIAISRNKNPKAYPKKALLRGFGILSAGFIITGLTFFFIPKQFIYFGVLHLIGVSVILSPLFANRKYWNIIAGLIIIAAPVFMNTNILSNPIFSWIGISPPLPTLDYFPIIPWMGIILAGVFFGNTLYPKGKEAVIKIEKPKNYFAEKIAGALEFAGKKAFIIYFIHQPVLLGIIWTVSILT